MIISHSQSLTLIYQLLEINIRSNRIDSAKLYYQTQFSFIQFSRCCLLGNISIRFLFPFSVCVAPEMESNTKFVVVEIPASTKIVPRIFLNLRHIDNTYPRPVDYIIFNTITETVPVAIPEEAEILISVIRAYRPVFYWIPILSSTQPPTRCYILVRFFSIIIFHNSPTDGRLHPGFHSGLTSLPEGSILRFQSTKAYSIINSQFLMFLTWNYSFVISTVANFNFHPRFNQTGKEINVQINLYTVTFLPNKLKYQDNIQIRNGAGESTFNKKAWDLKVRKQTQPFYP